MPGRESKTRTGDTGWNVTFDPPPPGVVVDVVVVDVDEVLVLVDVELVLDDVDVLDVVVVVDGAFGSITAILFPLVPM